MIFCIYILECVSYFDYSKFNPYRSHMHTVYKYIVSNATTRTEAALRRDQRQISGHMHIVRSESLCAASANPTIIIVEVLRQWRPWAMSHTLLTQISRNLSAPVIQISQRSIRQNPRRIQLVRWTDAIIAADSSSSAATAPKIRDGPATTTTTPTTPGRSATPAVVHRRWSALAATRNNEPTRRCHPRRNVHIVPTANASIIKGIPMTTPHRLTRNMPTIIERRTRAVSMQMNRAARSHPRPEPVRGCRAAKMAMRAAHRPRTTIIYRIPDSRKLRWNIWRRTLGRATGVWCWLPIHILFGN